MPHRRIVALSAGLCLTALIAAGCASGPAAPPELESEGEPIVEEPVVDLPLPDCDDTVLFGGYIGDLGTDEVESFSFPELVPEGALDRAGCLMISTPAGVGYRHEILWFFHADKDLYEMLRAHAERTGLDPVSWLDTDRAGYTWSSAELWDRPTDPADWERYEYHFLQSNYEIDREVIRDYVWEGSFLTYLEDSHPSVDTPGYISGYGPVILLGWIAEDPS